MKQGNLNILLIEDDQWTQRALVAQLEASFPKIDIVAAQSSEELQQRLEESDNSFDVVILDYMIPRSSGGQPEENSRALKQVRERQPNIPVIHTSAFTDDSSLADLVKREATAGLGFTRSAIVSKADPEWPVQISNLLQHAKDTADNDQVRDLGSEYSSCFISYSHNDEEFARMLYSKLSERGIRLWFAPEDMRAGQKLHEQIESGIENFDRLLLILSENSMTSSWVETEIRHALSEEKRTGQRKLLPISLVPFETIKEWKCFDADTGRDMAVEIREYLIPDFSSLESDDAIAFGINQICKAVEDQSG